MTIKISKKKLWYSEGYDKGKKELPPFIPNLKIAKDDTNKQEDVPEYLLCKLCNQLFYDASITQCCQKTFCYKCITDALLSSPNHKCPSCNAVNISAVGMVFPNRNTKKVYFCDTVLLQIHNLLSL